MRLFVYPTIKTQKAIAVIECEKVTKTKATLSTDVDLSGIKPGMIACPGEGRQVDRSTIYVVAEAHKDSLIFGDAPKSTPDILEEVEGTENI